MDETLKKKILIVEDDLSLLRGLVDKFMREGFAVFSANNGIEGLSSAFAIHPDIILLDIVMAQMDGLTTLQKLREKDAWGKDVPVIFLTNLSPDSDRIIAEIAKDEPAFYLVKSDFLLSDVVVKVRECLAVKEKERARV
jgi:DNA-binding response OmpR family regulator